MTILENTLREALSRTYGLEAQIRALPGEFDLNFDVTGETGRFVLKAMRQDCDPAFIDMQIKAMDHIRAAGLGVRIPEVITTKTGEKTFQLDERICWLISFLPGTVMADISSWSVALAASIGDNLGQMCKALASFEHKQLDRPLKWNMLESPWIIHHLSDFKDLDRRAVIEHILAQFESDVYSKLLTLDDAPIYNDANDMNILVETNDKGQQSVSGIIDFGDLTRSPVICEPAIAMAYAMMRDPNPIARGAALIGAFHKHIPLDEAELSILLPLIKMRLANTVTNALVERALHPDNAYLSISEAPAWELLFKLSKLDDSLVTEHFANACKDA